MAVSEENIRLIFGLKLKQLRDGKNLSLADLSGMSGVSISYLNEIEKGKKYPKSDKIIALADALGTSYDQLVSLKLSRNLAPVSELLNSDIIQELPFDTFGIDKSKLFDMIANAPAKITAFISTIVEIARNYNMKQEHFYFASLRSFQEMYDNYFENIEKSASEFAVAHKLSGKTPIDGKSLRSILEKEYNYQFEETDFKQYPSLKNFRSIYIPGKQPRLIMNKKLTSKQFSFLLAKEIGFQYMHLDSRPHTSSWLKVESFEQVLNNFYASYFAGALNIHKDSLLEDLEKLFKKKSWDSTGFRSIMDKYNASPEMFLHRLTNILPKHFGIHQMFFIRYSSLYMDEIGTRQPSKELHLSKMTNPFNKDKSEDFYRRTLSKNLVRHMLKSRKRDEDMIIQAVRAKFDQNGHEYFCIGVLRPVGVVSHNEDSVLMGFMINDSIRKKIKFLEDEKIFLTGKDASFEDNLLSKEEFEQQLEQDKREAEFKEFVMLKMK